MLSVQYPVLVFELAEDSWKKSLKRLQGSKEKIVEAVEGQFKLPGRVI